MNNGLQLLCTMLTDTSLPATDRAAAGLELVGIIGGLCFIGLLLCLGMYTLVEWWLHRTDDASANVSAQLPATPTAQTDDLALIAVLTAAVAMMLDKPASEFRVVSFHRTTQGRAWNAGQTE